MSLRMVADHGLTTSAMQQVADEMGVSRPYVFRLSGSKQSFVLACVDEPEGRAREVLRQAAATCPSDLLQAMGDGFQELVADGVISGLWLQACATARRNERVAVPCRSLGAAEGTIL
jgi:AcrR family transcriptional regulator